MSDYEVVGLERFHRQLNNNSRAIYKHVYCIDIVNSDTIRHITRYIITCNKRYSQINIIDI